MIQGKLEKSGRVSVTHKDRHKDMGTETMTGHPNKRQNKKKSLLSQFL